MKRFLEIVDEWGVRFMALLILVIFLKTCGTNGKINRLDKDIQSLQSHTDSSLHQIRKEIKIEGLKSEKRMIQSTDRKILEVNRQTEIDKELSQLEK